jgi:hypothetical protein
MSQTVFSITPGSATTAPQLGTALNTMFTELYNAFNWLTPSQFGAVDTTGAVACDVVLNLAIAAAIAQKKKLLLPGGFLKIDAPLMAGGANIFESVHIEGQTGTGLGEPTRTNYGSATVILPSYKDRPAIYTTASRAVTLKNFSIEGLNTAPVANVPPTDVQASYISAGCRSARYSPYCAIAIDPNNAATPADGGYPGMSYSQFVGSGASNILIENVNIRRFVVGVAHGLSGAQNNTDQVTYRNVLIQECDSAYAIGHAQAKIIVMDGGQIFYCRQGFDGLNYGSQNGCPPEIRRIQFGVVFRLFVFSNGFGPLQLGACYGESIRTLGTFGIGASTQRNNCYFDGGYYQIGDAWGNMPPLVLESYGPTIFKGVTLASNAASRDTWNFAGSNTSFEQCTFAGTAVNNVAPHIGITFNGSGGVSRLKDCWIAGSNGFLLSDEGVRSGSISTYSASGRLLVGYQGGRFPDGNTDYIYRPRDAIAYVQTLTTVQTLTSNFVITATTPAEIQVGDLILWLMLAQGPSLAQNLMPAMKVTSIVGATVTCSLLFDSTQYDSVANMAAYGANRVFLIMRQWAPVQALTCTTDGATGVITVVSPTGCLINGDWVVGAGIPANTRVVSGGGTATVTLSKNTTIANAGVALYFGRLYVPTITAAF